MHHYTPPSGYGYGYGPKDRRFSPNFLNCGGVDGWDMPINEPTGLLELPREPRRFQSPLERLENKTNEPPTPPPGECSKEEYLTKTGKTMRRYRDPKGRFILKEQYQRVLKEKEKVNT